MVLLKTLTKLMGFKVVVSFARNLGSPQLYMCNGELSEPIWTTIQKGLIFLCGGVFLFL
jgi:hypothetical protein